MAPPKAAVGTKAPGEAGNGNGNGKGKGNGNGKHEDDRNFNSAIMGSKTGAALTGQAVHDGKKGTGRAPSTECACKGRHWPACPLNPIHGDPIALLSRRLMQKRGFAVTIVASRWRGAVARKKRGWIKVIKSELLALRIGELKKRAQLLGCDPVAVHHIIDDIRDPIESLARLIDKEIRTTVELHKHFGSVEAAIAPSMTELSDELTKQRLTIRGLKERAVEAGVAMVVVDRAVDTESDPSAHLTELVIAASRDRKTRWIEARLACAVKTGAILDNLPVRILRMQQMQQVSWRRIVVLVSTIVAAVAAVVGHGLSHDEEDVNRLGTIGAVVTAVFLLEFYGGAVVQQLRLVTKPKQAEEEEEEEVSLPPDDPLVEQKLRDHLQQLKTDAAAERMAAIQAHSDCPRKYKPQSPLELVAQSV